MRAPIQLQCIFPYTILANPEVEPHAPNTYTQEKTRVVSALARAIKNLALVPGLELLHRVKTLCIE